MNKWIWRLIVALPLGLIAVVILHETGHAIGAILVGLDTPKIYIWPGIELYPDVANKYVGNWPKAALGLTELPSPQVSRLFIVFNDENVIITPQPQLVNVLPVLSLASYRPEYAAIVGLMGSGLTLIISVVCLGLLMVREVSGWQRSILIIGALFYLDFVAYCILPGVFNLPHLVAFGGTQPETVDALVALGFPRILVFLLCIMLAALHTRLLMHQAVLPHQTR